MKTPYVNNLKWEKYVDSNGDNYTELDSYAEMSFKNGIKIKVSTGEITHTTVKEPYELHARFPNGSNRSYPYLSVSLLEKTLRILEAIHPDELKS